MPFSSVAVRRSSRPLSGISTTAKRRGAPLVSLRTCPHTRPGSGTGPWSTAARARTVATDSMDVAMLRAGGSPYGPARIRVRGRARDVTSEGITQKCAPVQSTGAPVRTTPRGSGPSVRPENDRILCALDHTARRAQRLALLLEQDVAVRHDRCARERARQRNGDDAAAETARLDAAGTGAEACARTRVRCDGRTARVNELDAH